MRLRAQDGNPFPKDMDYLNLVFEDEEDVDLSPHFETAWCATAPNNSAACPEADEAGELSRACVRHLLAACLASHRIRTASPQPPTIILCFLLPPV